MGATIKDIAQEAGVSRGTVDRALNNRGRIDPEVEKRIREIAERLNYTVRKKKNADSAAEVSIGVVTQLAKASFMGEINRGIRQAQKELARQGVRVILREGLKVDEQEQLEAIDSLVSEGVQALAVMPVESNQVRNRLNELNIPVVTFNSDIVGTKRVCFVGMDNRKSGRTAAGLLGMLTRGRGKILVITGYFTNNVDNLRVEGFVEGIKASYPELEIVGVQGSFDEAQEVQRIIENTMQSIPELDGILVVSAGQAGVTAAFRKLSPERRPYVVVYDQTPKNEQALRENNVDFLIDQNGFEQGYRPPYLLAGLLMRGEQPKQDRLFTEIRIKTKENI